MLNLDLMKEFTKVYGDNKGAKTYFAPGRVNLIGEHIDYNGGYVLPCALSLGTYAVARKRDDKQVRFYSMNFAEDGIIETTLPELYKKTTGDWTNYPKGIIYTLLQGGYGIDFGLDILFYGTIPNSSGLSSSASIEVLMGCICMDLFGLDYDMPDLARICQHSENHYNGVACGIMDQFAIAMGKRGYALYLNTQTMEYNYVLCIMHGYRIVIMNTNKKRGLTDSKYNERRAECEEALKIIKEHCDISNFCELTNEEWTKVSGYIQDDTLLKRVNHVVTENERTIRAVEMIENQNLEGLGSLLNESHQSLKEDYEVTGVELDTLVAASMSQEGVLGARMTGAGFGGCAIAIVQKDTIDTFKKNVGEIYRQKIGYCADFYVVEVGGGPQIL